MSLFHECFHDLLGVEGRYSNHPDDRGGETMWGVTKKVARDFGYYGPMRELPVEIARMIYRKRYWDRMWLDEVGFMYPKVAKELFDTGVNTGHRAAIRFLQRCLNVLDKDHRPALVTDGRMGKNTLGELRRYHHRRGSRGQRVLVRGLDALQGARYIELAEADADQESFVFGWIDQRVGNY